MKTTTRLILKYFAIWIILSVSYFLLSEKIVKLITPGFDSIEIWLLTVAIGLGLIFSVTLITFLKAFTKRK